MKMLIPLILPIASTFFFYSLFKRYKLWIKKISACGYAEPPNPKAFAFVMWILRILTYIQVGEVRVIGRENLNTQGPMIVSPNHPHYVDAAIFPNLIQRQARYMVDEDVLRFGFGLGALILVPAGAFPARDRTRGSNLRTCETAVQFLSSGYPLMIFPEGHTNFKLQMAPLKKGAIRIAKMASQKLQKPVFIVPAHIRYGRYPSGWLQEIKPPLQYLLVLLASFYFRRGATVIFGTPISSADLPQLDKEACNYLAKNIQALDPGEQIYGVDKGMYESFAFIKL
jgi:1-acyl-sn-glycerol-3-phosphate acyltransferase